MKFSASADFRLSTALRTDLRAGLSPNSAPRALKPRTLTTLLVPLLLAGALLGLSSNAAAQLAVDLGADQTVAAGDTVTITAAVTGNVSPDADLVVDWSIPPISQGGLFGTVGSADAGRLIGAVNAATGLTLTLTASAADLLTSEVAFNINVSVTDPTAAAGQGPATDSITITMAPGDAPAPTSPTSITLSATPTTVTESADPTDITFTATLVGGTFDEARVINFLTQGGTATSGTDYTAVPSTNFTIPANTASISGIVPFEALVDTVADSGETAIFVVNLLDVPQENVVFSATATITIMDAAAEAVPLAVNAGDDQTVTAGDTVTITATVAGSNSPDAGLTVVWSLPDATTLFTDAALVPATRQDEAIRLNGVVATSNTLTLTFTATAANLLRDALDVTYRITVTDPNAAADQGPVTDDITITINDPAVPLAVNLGPDQSVEPGAQITITGTVTGANSPDADLTTAWQLLDADALLAALGAFVLGSLEETITGNTGLTLTFPATSAAALAAASLDSVVLGIRLRITDPNAAAGQGPVTDDIAIVVEPDTEPSFADGVIAIPGAVYYTTLPIMVRTLPAATGGNDPITYTLTPALSAGLTFDGATRVLSGTPTAAATLRGYTYTATDADDDTATLPFSFAVFENPAPVLPAITPNDYSFVQDATVALTLPAATGGNAPITYTLAPALPAGLTFGATARTITGAPTGTLEQTTFTYTASDSDPDTRAVDMATRTFRITVEADTAPDFGTATIDEQIFTTDTAVDLTLPAATGGNGAPYSYTLDPALPAGLTFNAAARPPTITGIPTTTLADTLFALRADDSDQNSHSTDRAELKFRITVVADTMPTFAADATIDDQNYIVGVAITPLPLPAVETDGNGATTYTLTPALPDGLTFDATTTPPTLTGTPTAAAAVTEYTYTATDEDDDTAPLTFNITVEADTEPSFGTATIDDQNYIEGQMIAPLTLPAAEAGNAPIIYTLAPALPAGLTFDTATSPPTISGKPTATVSVTDYTYTATDANDDTAPLTFSITVEANTAPSFGSETIDDQNYLTETAVDLTLPVATGGNGEIQYTLLGPDGSSITNLSADIPGLTFNPTARTITGTPTATALSMAYSWVASDSDADTGTGDQSTLTFNITVEADTAPTFADGVTIADQNYIENVAITPLTLPVATGGNGEIKYTLFGSDGSPIPNLSAVIPGLTLDTTARTITGTPTAAAAETEYTYTAIDADDDTAPLTFNITVEADTTPAFADGETIAPATYIAGVAITARTLPAVTDGSGNAPITYTLTPALPAGLTLDPATGVLSGTPNAAAAVADYTYTATDANDDTATLTFNITVEADTTPAFADGSTIAAQNYLTGTTVDLTLPAVTDGSGNAPITYTLSPALPDGLTFNPTSPPTITGTPNAAAAVADYTYTATDANSDTAPLTFDITVVADTEPAFADGVTIADQNYLTGTTVDLTLPAVTDGSGNAPITYTLAPALPDGLTFNPTSPPTITGTPTAAAETDYTYTATDADDDTATLTFSITVEADTEPSFGTSTIAAQNYLTGTTVDLTLPAVTDGSGNAPITYTLAPALPDGLTFKPTSPPTITGTPTAAAAVADYTYTATDANDDTAPLTFSITVNAPATGFSLEVVDRDSGLAVSEVLEGTTRDLRVTATPTPAGSAFAADQMVTFTVTPPPLASPPANAADPYVVYTAVAPGTMPLAVGAASAGFEFTLATTNDNVDHADFPLTMTATAESSGISGTAAVTLLDNDIRITTTTASATVVAGATATYEVTLSEAPPDTITVTVASQDAATATVSPATLTFSVGDWNMAQTVTVTGVAMGSTSISHTAPDNSGFTFIPNDVAVTVAAPAVAAPVFTNAAAFTSPIDVEENQTAVGDADYFGASDTSTGNLVLSGADMSVFTLSSTGTLTFNTAPNFEEPRGADLGPGNLNNYALTVTATNSTATTTENFTVRVTDVNDPPVLDPIQGPTDFVEYTQTEVTINAIDEDRPDQELTYSLDAPTYGATIVITSNSPFPDRGQFSWTPREEDGGQTRTFTVTVTDDGTPPASSSRDYSFAVRELANRAPTGVTLTIADGATSVTNPATLDLTAAATDPDTGTTLTYTWSSDATGGSFTPATGTSTTTTWTPPPVTSATPVVLTVTVTDGDATTPLTTTATQNVMVNPMPVAPAFTNMAMFTTPIMAAENQTAVGAANFFVAPGTGATTLTLGGTDATRFAITNDGTLTFDGAPNFEEPRGMPIGIGNLNNYALTVTATNGVGSVESGPITVRVTDANDAPVLDPIQGSTDFVEYTEDEVTINAIDEDRPDQELTYSLDAPTYGATIVITSNFPFPDRGQFTWTPREEDGGQTRTFTVTVTDDGTPPASSSRDYSFAVRERPNQAPTGATLTIAGGATMVTNPATLDLTAAATDPDTGDVLTYTWSSDATGDSFTPATGATTTWMPPTVTAATPVILTVTVTDSTDGSVTATQDVTVNPPVPTGTAPVFTNMAMFTTAITVPENTTAAGAANFFVATGTAPVNLTLGGTDATRFAITDAGTLTFNDAPNFEEPRGADLGSGNLNDYALTVTAMNAFGSAQSRAITVRVTDANDAPVLEPIQEPINFVEYTEAGVTIRAIDEDRPDQELSYSLTGDTHGATIVTETSSFLPDIGRFTWTPREEDGGQTRTFTVTVTDDGDPPRSGTKDYSFAVRELPNRAPTGVITAAAAITSPNTLALMATATDLDTGDTVTYAWAVTSAEGGTITPLTGATATYTPPTLTAGDTALTVIITLTVSDGTLSTMDTHTVTVNSPAPTGTAPVFTNMASFATPIDVEENQTAIATANFFAAPGTGTTTLTLGGDDATRFAITNDGTLTFNEAPNFERPRGTPITDTNTNDYALIVTATNGVGSVESGPITVRVIDVNDPPVLIIPTLTFEEYTEKGFNINVIDEDIPQQGRTYVLAPNAFGATLENIVVFSQDRGRFTWTPREEDGGQTRMFTVTVTDDGIPPMSDTRDFSLTVNELPNRAPTAATLTVAGGATMVTNPATLGLTAAATDPDTGDVLTYTWSAAANGGGDGGSFVPATGATTTWMPPTVTAATMVTLTVTITDFTDGSVTATQDVMVNPPVPTGTAPVFTNMASFATPIEAAENQTAVAAANFFVATGTGTVTLTLGGDDASRFEINDAGTLAFRDAPNFEEPRGADLGVGNLNDYALTVSAMNDFGSTPSGAITVRVTNANDAPVFQGIPTPSNIVEYTQTGFTINARDEDSPRQRLTFVLADNAFGATVESSHHFSLGSSGVFAWTPREEDGGQTRTFTVTVTDNGTPPLSDTRDFSLDVAELPNQAPTGVTITAAAAITSPNPLALEATATDPDTGTTLTYTWAVTSAEGGTITPTTGVTATYTPPTLTAGDAARTITITLTVSDGTLSTTAMHTITVNPPVPTGTAPVFTNMASFATPIEAAENQTAIATANFFVAPGTGATTLTLGGDDATRFAITDDGTLTFDGAPNFERPRGMAFDADTNTNDYALIVTATNGVGSMPSGAITVRVTDVNEAPVLVPPPTSSGAVEYTLRRLRITASDEDFPTDEASRTQTLTYTLTGDTHGATIETDDFFGNFRGEFAWTPGEEDGGQTRMFTVMVTDDGTPALSDTIGFSLAVRELANRAPTAATITGATTLVAPATITLEATAEDPDTGTTLTYTWAVTTAEGGTIAPLTGESVTYTPPTLATSDTARMIEIMVTASDGATPPLTDTDTHTVTVNPPAPTGTPPVFTNMAMFASAIEVPENTFQADRELFATTGTGTVTLTLGGDDASRFVITDAGTLSFRDFPPNFEEPRGTPITDTNTNDYALIVTATNAVGSVESGAITVRVTDVNDPPVLFISAPSNIVEYTQTGFTITAQDEDRPRQQHTFVLADNAFGATLVSNHHVNGSFGTFAWTPGEDDGGQTRMFTVMVTDDGIPALSDTVGFRLDVAELANRAPTNAAITAAGAITSPNTLTLGASATDPDTGTTLTYTWAVTTADGGTIAPTTGASATYTPPTLVEGDAVRMIVITLTVSDDDATPLTATATHTVTVNPPVSMGTAPAFTNMAMFSTAIEAEENQSAVGAANFFVAPGTGATTLTLGGTDATRFAITNDGTLTFDGAPNFEQPRGTALSDTNTNDYALIVTATNGVGSVESGAITVTVTDANDPPVLRDVPNPPGFVEYTGRQRPITIIANDEDRPDQVLSYSLTGDTHGATIEDEKFGSYRGNFRWTPGEEDGGQTRMFTVMVIDDGIPPMSDTRDFSVTAEELPNRPPTDATMTTAGSATMVTNPATLGLTASATDPDTGDMLTYTWSSSATGDTFAPATGASTTWTPPTVTAATPVTLTVTITDTTDGSVTAMQEVTVNPMPVTPVFTNAAAFASPIEVEENQSAVRAAGYFAATGSGTVTLTLGGADMSRFTLTNGGTLTFNTAPDFEMPRGAAFNADTNTNDYPLTITAMNDVGTVESGAITVRVTNANEAPVLAAIPTPTFTEYTAGGFTITATDVDRPAQTLAFALTGETHGAALTAAGGFSWTPREMDGTVVRMFTAEVADSGTPPQTASVTFAITAMELANRPPTGATITAADGATSVTNPATLDLTAAATDPDTGDMLTYTWSVPDGGGSFVPATGTATTTTWTPPDVTTATTYTLTVTITDSTDGSVTATQNVTVNPMPVTPTFDNPDTLAFTVVEGTTAVGTAGQFSATGTGVVTLTLGGTDAGLFTLTNSGTLTFNTAPDFEMPRGMALSGTNQNNFPLTVVATASGLSSDTVSFLVRVSNANEAPVLGVILPPAFEEYTAGSFEITATDVDGGDTLAYTLDAPTHGATVTGNTFSWTPGEDDGDVLRTFTLRVTDDGTPPMSDTRGVNITAMELPNRAPTGATITAAATLTSPNPITLMASATDPDTGTTLTYAWAVTTADGGTIAPLTGASTTYTPPTLAKVTPPA